MSYEGCVEYLTKSGRHLVYDIYEEPTESLYPDDPFEWVHYVDLTNGFDDTDKDTKLATGYAPTTLIGYLESEHTDYKGNKYFTRESLYAPDPQNNEHGWQRWKKSI